MKNQIRLPRKIALRFELIFLKLSSASDWIICTKEYELIKSGHTFGLLAVFLHSAVQIYEFHIFIISSSSFPGILRTKLMTSSQLAC